MDIALQQVLLIAGRVLIGALFVVAGILHFFETPRLTQKIAARGMPAPKVVLIAASSFQILAGLLLMLGVCVPAIAVGLILFTLAASILMLNFWNMEDPARAQAINVWLSNVAIIGGLLLAIAQPV